jgi:DNA polymerase-3 subunit delta'
MTLHPLFGHDEARRMVAQSFGAGRLPSSLLLHGPKGVGKQRFALWIAQLAVCDAPSLETGPCEGCRSCRLLLNLEHPDVHWYMPLPRPTRVSGDRLVDALEDARHEMLAELRQRPLRPSHSQEVAGLYMGTVKNVRKRASVRPSMAAGPVFVIGDAELLVPQEASQEAANALLKLLEEPPGAARFILTSSVPGSLLPTIRSRTVPLLLSPLPDEHMRSALVAWAGVPEEDAGRIARLGRGSLGRALGFLPRDAGEKEPMNELRRGAFEILRAAIERRGAGAPQLALGYAPAGARGLIDLLEVLEEWIRDLGVVLTGTSAPAIHHDAAEALGKLASRSGVDATRVPWALPAVERARELARGNVNPQLVVSGLVLELGRALFPTPGRVP